VRRFPHALSKLADVCRYGVLTSFLHSLHARVMRKGEFTRCAVERFMDMRRNGYSADKLMVKLTSFIRHHLSPDREREPMLRRLRRDVAQAVVEAQQTARVQWALRVVAGSTLVRQYVQSRRRRAEQRPQRKREAGLQAAYAQAAKRSRREREVEAEDKRREAVVAGELRAAAERSAAAGRVTDAALLDRYEAWRRDQIQASNAEWMRARDLSHMRVAQRHTSHLLTSAAQEHVSSFLGVLAQPVVTMAQSLTPLPCCAATPDTAIARVGAPPRVAMMDPASAAAAAVAIAAAAPAAATVAYAAAHAMEPSPQLLLDWRIARETSAARKSRRLK
jgi:hypothetical protein